MHFSKLNSFRSFFTASCLQLCAKSALDASNTNFFKSSYFMVKTILNCGTQCAILLQHFFS
eukprot:UN22056